LFLVMELVPDHLAVFRRLLLPKADFDDFSEPPRTRIVKSKRSFLKVGQHINY
jgi:hypothetical protein